MDEIPVLEPPDMPKDPSSLLLTAKLRAEADRGIPRVPLSAWVRVVDKAEEIQEVAMHDGRIYRLKYNRITGDWAVKEEF